MIRILSRTAFAGLCALLLMSCEKKAEKGGFPISCYTDVQFVCEERVSPTIEQEDALKVVCSSGSGKFSKPAACPRPGYLGKCAVTKGDLAGTTRRFYTGADAAYAADFCVNTAHGIWSTAF